MIYNINDLSKIKRKYKTPKPSQPSKPKIKDTTKEDINQVLNFLLMHNIIDHQQYNELLIKSLPYTK